MLVRGSTPRSSSNYTYVGKWVAMGKDLKLRIERTNSLTLKCKIVLQFFNVVIYDERIRMQFVCLKLSTNYYWKQTEMCSMIECVNIVMIILLS